MQGYQFICVCFLLAIVFGGSCVTAMKCYQCDSHNNPACSENFFMAITTFAEGCTCCTKTVTSELTKRDCSTIACVPLPSHYACYSELCNGSERHVTKQSVLIGGIFLSTAIAMLYRHL